MRVAITKWGFLVLVTAVALQFAAPSVAQTAEGNQQGLSGVAQATEDALLDPNLYVGIQEAYQNHLALRMPEVNPQNMKSLFFTLWQHRLLQEQRRGAITRDPTQQEIQSSTLAPESRIRGIRELSLGGIVYVSGDDWVLWLNGQRVTPKAIPKQVIDLNVRQDFIELKWYNSWTNLIFPVRLRPHQRFNLDTRIFLPGTAASL